MPDPVDEKLDTYLKPACQWAWRTDKDHRFEYLSDNFPELTGVDPADVLGLTRTRLIKRDCDMPFSEGHRNALDACRPFHRFRYPWETANGQIGWVESSGAPRFDKNGTFLGYQGVARDITAEIEAEGRPQTIDRETRLQQALLGQIERVSKIGAWRWTLAGDHFHCSDEILRIYELPVGTTMTLESALDAYDDEARAMIEAAIKQCSQSHAPYDVTTRFTSTKGTERWVRTIGVPEVIDDEITRFYGTLQDVTEQRSQQMETQRLAMTDPLTGIANRMAFNKRLNALIANPHPRSEASILCVIDLDGFKQVNDQYGHDVGDELLRWFAESFVKGMNEDWFFARMGGDEFGLIVNKIDEPDEFAVQINALLAEIATKVHLDDIGLHVVATAGYTILPKDGVEAKALLRRADLALYEAKRDPQARVRCFEVSMEEAFRRRVLVAQEFRQALRDEQIVPHYQPVVALDSGQIVGMEALARWHRPGKGVLSPAVFMEVFADQEICVCLTELMLRRVCADMRQWIQQGVRFGRVGLNVTEADLRQPGFALRVISTLSHHDLHPHHLMLEMTETTIFANADNDVIQQLQQLRTAGVTIALDDFGTGYSSLIHLRNVPFDILKIDRSFVKDMMRSPSSRAIVHSLVKLGNDIGYSTVAEGVEVKSEANYLREIGCESGQGYFFYKPMSKQDIDNLLVDHTQIAV